VRESSSARAHMHTTHVLHGVLERLRSPFFSFCALGFAVCAFALAPQSANASTPFFTSTTTNPVSLNTDGTITYTGSTNIFIATSTTGTLAGGGFPTAPTFPYDTMYNAVRANFGTSSADTGQAYFCFSNLGDSGGTYCNPRSKMMLVYFSQTQASSVPITTVNIPSINPLFQCVHTASVGIGVCPALYHTCQRVLFQLEKS